MNAVGIDVSKGKSMVCIMRPFGEIVASPYEVAHVRSELSELAKSLKSLPGETKIILECTGSYHLPMARALHDADLFVCTVNPQLIHGFGNNTIRKTKNDKKDSAKIANYGLTHWLDLPRFQPEEDIRHMLKAFSRQYSKYSKLKTMLKNNLVSLTDQTFPDVNQLFTSPPKKDGREKWLDFTMKFWHCECVSALSQREFTERYRKCCKRNGYNFSDTKAEEIYFTSAGHVSVMPKNEMTKNLVTQAISQLNSINVSIAFVAGEMSKLASQLPENSVVMEFYGVGEILASQLIAEIGDIYRYQKKSSLVRFAGLEPVENSSGQFQGREKISKQGSPHLRKTLFLVMNCILQKAPNGDPIFDFLDRKRDEVKHYYCYMNAGCAKFLRIYYARVKEHLDKFYDDAITP